MTTPESSNVYEMFWDCDFCGSTKLLGKTHRFCPNCGSPQDASRRYFPSDDEKVAVKDHVFVGVDKVCGSCGNLNGGNSSFCGRCGAPLEGAKAVGIQKERVRKAGEKFEGEDLQTRLNQERDAAVGRVPKAKPMTRRGRWAIYAIVGTLLAVCGLIAYAMFATRTETVVVAAHRWENEIRIEQLKQETGKSDCDRVPSGAYNVDRRREQVDTRRVPDGETCQNVQVDQGDGTFRQERQCETKYRNEPIYGDVCYYDINRWSYERSVTSEGSLSEVRSFAATGITRRCTTLGCEREQDREERFFLVFGSGDDTFECAVDQDVWENTGVEDTFTIDVGVVAGDKRCGSLERTE